MAHLPTNSRLSSMMPRKVLATSCVAPTLLQSTAWQSHLQEALKLHTPRYAHLPLVMEDEHGKLSKSRRSLAIDPARAGDQLVTALGLLNHPPPRRASAGPCQRAPCLGNS